MIVLWIDAKVVEVATNRLTLIVCESSAKASEDAQKDFDFRGE